MKRLVLGLTALMSLSSFAAIDCKPYTQEVDAAQLVVNNFDAEMIKLQAKVITMEEKIRAKEDQMSDATRQIQAISLQLGNIEADRLKVLDQLRQVQAGLASSRVEEARLINRINTFQREVDRGNNTRANLRELNRAKKDLENLQAEMLPSIQQEIRINNQLAQIATSRNPLNAQINQLEQQRSDIANANPTIAFLTQRRDEAQRAVDDEQRLREAPLRILDAALERQLMCKTYTVKYPVALRVAKEIERVGCNRYTPIENNGPFALDAEREVLQALCNRN